MKIFFLFLLGFQCINIFGQVNLQTGGATFSLPIFNWHDNKSSMGLNVSINYHSGNGLKVNEVASNIGQGWGFDAGGVITRIQVGQPDDQKPYEGNGTNDINKYPAGYLYNSVNATAGCPMNLTKYPIFSNPNQVYKQPNSFNADRELDFFSFQFNGRQGLFVLGKNNGDIGVSIGDSKMKIWFERDENMPNIRTAINIFYIQDENGMVYKFEKHGLTKLLNVHPSDQTFLNRVSPQVYQNGGVYYESEFDEVSINPYIISSWYLTEIKDPLTSRTVTFNYEIRHIKDQGGDNIRSCRMTGESLIPFGPLVDKWNIIVSHSVAVTETPVISEINYPDGYKVSFKYDMDHPRADLNKDYPIQSVSINYNSRPTSSFQFNTTYSMLGTMGIPVNDYQKGASRLYLKSIQKIGVDLKDEEGPLLFDYYTGTGVNDDIVPPPFCCQKDIWGYYNGSRSNDQNISTTLPYYIPYYSTVYGLSFDQLRALCFINVNTITSTSCDTYYSNINSGYAKNGLLHTIRYPTGGVLNYNYEQNLIHIVSTDQVMGGVHVSSTSFNDGGYSNGSNPIVTNYKYLDETGTYSSLWGYETPNNENVFSSHYAPQERVYRYTFECAPTGCCSYRYKDPGILSKEDAVDIKSGNDFQVIAAAGLKVYSLLSLTTDLRSLIMKFSSSSLYGVISSFLESAFTTIVSCTDNENIDKNTITYSNSNINEINPLPRQFKRVEVISGFNSSDLLNGKTTYEFTSSDDYPIWENSNDLRSLKQRSAYWTYGLPKKICMYDKNGIKVKQTEYNYDWTHNVKHQVSDLSCNCFVMHTASTIDVNYFVDPIYNSISDDELKVDPYSTYSGRLELTDVYENIFKSTDQSQYLTSSTHYEYNQTNFQIRRVTTTQSNGDKNFKEIYYPVDYSTSGVLQTLKDNNIIDVPVSTYSSLQKQGSSSTSYISASVTEFTMANYDIKPKRQFAGRSTQPVTTFSFDPTNQFNYPGLKETQSYTYDQAGNLIGLKDEGNHIVTNILDYDDRRVVASVVNADPLLDKSAYTSFETESLGGWTLNGTPAYTANSSITGSRSFTLSSSNSLSALLNSSKSYRLSFWSTNNLNISGATLIKSSPLINGFTFYEYELPSGNSSISISGDANIDELRLYPTNARIRTSTYDPLIGKTSECDENNRIIYYEYDNLGRLRFIKDENKNVVKMYEYNSKQ